MKISSVRDEGYESERARILALTVLGTGHMNFITKTAVSIFSVLAVTTAFKASAAAATVHMSGSTFDPLEITINAGETVEFNNNDNTEHTVTSYPDATFVFNSMEIEPGDSFNLTFDSPGDYPYYCIIHGFGMSGTVHVSAAAPNTPPATPTNVSPANNATNQPTTVSLTASAFSDSDSGDTQSASEWIVRKSSDSSVVIDTGELTDSASFTTYSATGLAQNTGYDWQVRYKDSHGAWSEYSSATHFTTVVPTPPAVPVKLTAVGITNGFWKLLGTGAPSAHLTVQATTNWVQWTNIGAVTGDVSGGFSFIDSNSVNFQSRFYRTTNQ